MLLKIRITGARGFGPTPQPASARRSKQYPLSQGLGLRVRVGRRKPHPGATLYTFTYIYTHIHIYTHTHINIYIYTHTHLLSFTLVFPGADTEGSQPKILKHCYYWRPPTFYSQSCCRWWTSGRCFAVQLLIYCSQHAISCFSLFVWKLNVIVIGSDCYES